MMEEDTGREADELYVPTPEELERGIEPRARERRPGSPEEARKRGRLDWARRLFRLGRGVGQDRSEVPAPAPPPAIPDPAPSAHSTKPEPASGTRADTPSVSQRSAGAPQSSKEPPVRNRQTTLPQTVEPAEPPSRPATTSKSRIRRVSIPERTHQPVRRPASGPVDEWVLEKALKKGHRLAPFREQRSALASEHDRRYVSECHDCKLKAYAIKAADPGWTTANTPWETQGSAFEKHCRGDIGE